LSAIRGAILRILYPQPQAKQADVTGTSALRQKNVESKTLSKIIINNKA
jgi:hypothetical protein